ncbi:hypothetical protein ASPZODRAFT_133830 [Penicilliopsis zonata CBS 506.65]|uniref:Carboxylesterase type B domain-containing protein n=1 Tax=Penicilliopsis zonata CBS 506.65 TaxID=1073090 RepID=A0A1L9SDI2_9EURO|nr:hypothetical protein ASPZODRAFT_133830 [Penicilliopsis zonata CBS 506.65]OJJ45202.1 hypothetical protein ASPZODRAFT_133830 [Penicilliopsis zonata CBS 506.65]
MTPTYRHFAPSLGAELVGEQNASIAVFRGIPYATTPQRWQHSTPLDTLSSPFDASRYGPRCPEAPGDMAATPGDRDGLPPDDELACLNLNIAVPTTALETDSDATSRPLPVMVWIHGGAFRFGSNSVPRDRPEAFLAHAIAAGNPLVVVHIGYRLGPLGFAASSDLADDNSSHGNGLPAGNYGFVDQRNAFQWVQAHIRDFGGNPENVTAMGVSAGGASVYFHLLTQEPLFDRGVCMSGIAPGLGPFPRALYETAWGDLCETLAITDALPNDRVRRLRETPVDQLLASYTEEPLGPGAGGALLPAETCYPPPLGLDAIQAPRCKALMLGDSRVEGIIFDGLFAAVPFKDFIALATTVLGPSNIEGFLNAFQFPCDGDAVSYRDAMRHFFSTVLYHYPNLLIADRSTTADVFLYHFEEPSVYPGPMHGLPFHGLCSLFLFNNTAAMYPPSQQQTARTMAQWWSAFAWGKAPWESYAQQKQVMQLGPEGRCEMTQLDKEEPRDHTYLPWLKEEGRFDLVKTLIWSLALKTVRMQILKAH